MITPYENYIVKEMSLLEVELLGAGIFPDARKVYYYARAHVPELGTDFVLLCPIAQERQEDDHLSIVKAEFEARLNNAAEKELGK